MVDPWRPRAPWAGVPTGWEAEAERANSSCLLAMGAVGPNPVALPVDTERAEPWQVLQVDAGDGSMTGGRPRGMAKHVADERAACFANGRAQATCGVRRRVAAGRFDAPDTHECAFHPYKR